MPKGPAATTTKGSARTRVYTRPKQVVQSKAPVQAKGSTKPGSSTKADVSIKAENPSSAPPLIKQEHASPAPPLIKEEDVSPTLHAPALAREDTTLSRASVGQSDNQLHQSKAVQSLCSVAPARSVRYRPGSIDDGEPVERLEVLCAAAALQSLAAGDEIKPSPRGAQTATAFAGAPATPRSRPNKRSDTLRRVRPSTSATERVTKREAERETTKGEIKREVKREPSRVDNQSPRYYYSNPHHGPSRYNGWNLHILEEDGTITTIPTTPSGRRLGQPSEPRHTPRTPQTSKKCCVKSKK